MTNEKGKSSGAEVVLTSPSADLSVPMSETKRLDSLDALRGANMFFIMGGAGLFSALAAVWPDSAVWKWIANQMGHVEWHGFAQHDMIFPTFLLIAGIAFPFSLAKQRRRGRSTIEIVSKIIVRALVLVLFGILVNNAVNFDFPNLRYASVLGHIGLAWAVAALITMILPPKGQVAVLVTILVGYWLCLRFVVAPDAPAGTDPYSMEGSLVGYIDRQFLPGRLYKGIHDPEGIFSLVPAVGTALIGVLTGQWLRREDKSGVAKMTGIFAAGVLLIVLGRLWNLDFPINKNLWTSSFVCFAGGLGLVALAVFYGIIDVLGWKKWAFFFIVIGMNPITIYLAQRIIGFKLASEFFFGDLAGRTPQPWDGVVTAAGYVLVCWAFLLFLWRRKIFLKV